MAEMKRLMINREVRFDWPFIIISATDFLFYAYAHPVDQKRRKRLPLRLVWPATNIAYLLQLQIRRGGYLLP